MKNQYDDLYKQAHELPQTRRDYLLGRLRREQILEQIRKWTDLPFRFRVSLTDHINAITNSLDPNEIFDFDNMSINNVGPRRGHDVYRLSKSFDKVVQRYIIGIIDARRPTQAWVKQRKFKLRPDEGKYPTDEHVRKIAEHFDMICVTMNDMRDERNPEILSIGVGPIMDYYRKGFGVGYWHGLEHLKDNEGRAGTIHFNLESVTLKLWTPITRNQFNFKATSNGEALRQLFLKGDG